MSDSFKFIHAADFHLDQPISGLPEIPNHLTHSLANAPYLAAQKVFDFAISERVDFVLLAGDLYESEAGNARAAAFLLNQFQRLNEKGITIYWCGGQADHPERWPGAIELPENVVTFASGLVEVIPHRRDGTVIARIIGSGYNSKLRNAENFAAPDLEQFNIALAHGEFDPSTITGTSIRYWALGGKHKQVKIEQTETVIAYPGTPQSRHPKELGVHGFNLCRVDTSGKLRVQAIESDRVRWVRQKLLIREDVALPILKNELADRATKLIADTTEQVVLCNWYFSTEGGFNPKIRTPEWKSEILGWLREEFGRTDRGLWSVAIKVEAARNLPSSWYDEDTILGEYLRAVGRFQSDETLRLDFSQFLPRGLDSSITQGFNGMCELQRDEVLRRSAMLGVEYLAKHREIEVPATAGTEA